eukprot:TRINITY_DN9034_c0_g1_i1.p1 TRINITY_DN9034_c0_g1~~TRINITY_DN9034_c0_g1_i1.p1  ORF type:complete len:373 (+),score=78.17 TRINITY_DN9034_c0_g1_i1:955-2073(+)
MRVSMFITQLKKTLVELLLKEDDSYSIPVMEISKNISRNQECLSRLLQLGCSDEGINVHNPIEKDTLEIDEVIGKGGVGAVYEGSYNGSKVAIKFFEVDDMEFRKELSLLSIIKSDHIVKCFGGNTIDDEKFIVLELMTASLADVLASTEIEIDFQLVVEMGLDAAHAIKFLHDCQLIHRDLKSLNLLVSNEMRVKICDFGLTRVVDNNMTHQIGTVSWIAPELFSKKDYTEKADIYSFGIVMWELISRQLPFPNIPSYSIPILVTKGERPTIPDNCPRDWKNLMKKAWKANPIRRPTMDDICKKISRMRDVVYKNKRSKGIPPKRIYSLYSEGAVLLLNTEDSIDDGRSIESSIFSTETSMSITTESSAYM